MIVSVKPLMVIDAATRQESDGGQYRIFVDEKFVGLLPYHNGAKVMLHKRFSPLELKDIETQVRVLVIPQDVSGIVHPELPPARVVQDTRSLYE